MSAAYADDLPGHLDLVHLGIAADGHTASLIPVIRSGRSPVAWSRSAQTQQRLAFRRPAYKLQSGFSPGRPRPGQSPSHGGQ